MPRLSFQIAGMSRARRIGLAVLAAAVVAAGFIPFGVRSYSEADLYAVGGARMRTGEEIYRLDERAFAYPPLFGVPGIALSYLPELWYRLAWYLGVAATLAAVTAIVMRRVPEAAGDASRQSPWPFWGLVMLLAARHLLAPVENQSHDLLIFLLMLCSLTAWMRSADVWAGVWAGVAAACKLTPLLLLPLFVWQRKWRSAVALIVTGLVLTLATEAAWPRQDGRLWSIAWYETFLNRAQPGDLDNMPNWDPWNRLNQSASGTLHRLLMPLPENRLPGDDRTDVSVLALKPQALKAVTLTVLGSIFAWMLYVTRTGLTRGLSERRRQFLQWGQGGVLLVAMVLLSPTSIKTHFAVLLLPIAVCTADYLWHGRDRFTLAALTITFVAGSLTTKEFLGRELGNVVMTTGSVTLVAVALFIATGRIVLLRSRQWRAEAAATSSPIAEPLRRAA